MTTTPSRRTALVQTALAAAAVLTPLGRTAMAQSGPAGARAVRAPKLAPALRIVIPGIVNTFIGLFKDTTLVTIVGIFDFLRTIEATLIDPTWATPSASSTPWSALAAPCAWTTSVPALRRLPTSSTCRPGC